MTEQLSNALPKESLGQRIGRLAGKCFEANNPNSWATTATDGDCDFGYDYQVQLIENGLAKDIFRVQLKGTTKPSLNADGSSYSLSIGVSTANYYARAIEPVLLVLCDLSVDIDHPKNCPLYFLWIHEDLRRLRGETGVRKGQDSVTLHVPKANKLDDTTDLSGDITRFRALSKIGHHLDIVVESEKPALSASERAEMASKIVQNLDSKSAGLIEALADDTQSSWVEAPIGTLHWQLKEAASALQSGRGEDCQRALEEASKLLDNAKPLEKADYWNAEGRRRTFMLDDTGARDAFELACKLSDDAERHLIPWAEAELRTRYQIGGVANFSEAIARLKATTPSIVGMRARLTAAEGRYDDAIAITDSIDGLEKHIARAIIFSMQAGWDESIQECEAGLIERPLRATTKQLFLILRARARFSKAIGPIDFGNKEESYLPAPGPAGTNVSLLHSAWTDIAEAITALRSAGWPGNVELLSDMWSATATMLGLQKQALPVMAEAAAARPTLSTLQAGLESLAAQAGEFKLALAANARQPESPRKLQQRIVLLHATEQHQECVKLLESRWDSIADNSLMFGFALIQAIHSAERIIQPELAKRWTQELESRAELAAHNALFNYFRTISKKPLEKDQALKALVAKYESLGRPHLIAKHLINELDGRNEEQGKLCIEVADVLKAAQMLDLDDSTRLAQALTTLGRWGDLLMLSTQALSQFEGNDRLSAIGAIALDKLGRTSEAHALLKSIVEKANPDDLALSVYIRIASRSGFADQAIAALEHIYGGEKDQAKQLECLRNLFSLLYQSDPNNPRLLEIAWEIGQKANQEDELQEGVFLTTMFAATLTVSKALDEEKGTTFQSRILAFTARFPNSRILKSVPLPDDASANDLTRILEKIVGTDEKQRKWRQKLQTELNLGTAPIPYAWRPRHVLDSISDLPTLWEASKRSSWGARQLHLTMATSEWKPIGLAQLRNQVPLLDFLSLMVIADLDLIEPLFKLFPKIAIGKSTLLELQNLLTPLSGSLYRNKLLALQSALRMHFNNIEQPEAEPPKEESFAKAQWSSLEIIEIAKSGKYLIYSDDALFRIYAERLSVCTLDLLDALDEAGLLTAKEVATRIATLCSWRVGLNITLRYQLAILPDALGRAKSINEGIDALMADELCNALFSGIWNPGKTFNELLAHAGTILRQLADDDQNLIQSVAALAGFWLGKAKLHKEAPTPIERIAGLLIAQALFDARPITPEAACRLWSVYHDLIEREYGNFMDDDKYQQSIRIIGVIAAETDKQHSLIGERTLHSRLASGLTVDTSDYDIFTTGYAARHSSIAL